MLSTKIEKLKVLFQKILHNLRTRNGFFKDPYHSTFFISQHSKITFLLFRAFSDVKKLNSQIKECVIEKILLGSNRAYMS